MAIKQTRRTVSLSRAVYKAIMAEAARRGCSAAAVIESALRRTGMELPAVAHVESATIAKMRKGRGYAPVKMRPSLERQMLGDGVANALGFR
jgi:hypothetical protein